MVNKLVLLIPSMIVVFFGIMLIPTTLLEDMTNDPKMICNMHEEASWDSYRNECVMRSECSPVSISCDSWEIPVLDPASKLKQRG